MKKFSLYLVIAVLTGFGLLTLFLSSSVIFDLFEIREKEGNYVLFVVWANFLSSFLYLIAVYGIMTSKTWTYKTLAVSILILTVAFIGLLFHIQSGGIYETKTLGAMVFRIVMTFAFALFAYFTINKNPKK
ncbi:hypothetical protein SAMN00777080_4694 [Aquiflexum balticum DSM 16537]|uniref:Uncharacterized protein n=1 Tax=Aquiflexum balticum DSM 16537 TaxID=758820 RepID=A0A1W2HBB6_9BACT|nr:hypothetical protein [Aquiflexum balticum]SMD46018.1 hypothetical protein SAMN00777080_4694 [Aquiflexum balticum DSM 16537]